MSPQKTLRTHAPDEQSVRLMIDGHSAVVLLIDPETGDILDANQAAANFYGYSRSKLCGMSSDEINTVPPEQAVVDRQKMLNGEQNYFVFSHRLAGGEERIVEIYSFPIMVQKKRALFSIIHDLTERKQSDIGLQKEIAKENEEKIRSITEHSRDLISITDANGVVTYASSASMSLFYFTPEEMCGRFFVDFLHESSIPIAMAAFRDAFDRDEWSKDLQLTMKRKDGSLFVGELNGSSFRYGEQNGSLVVIRDITERQQVDEALRKSEERYRSLFNSMMDGIYRSTHAGKFVDVNPAMVKMFGYASKEEMLDVDIKKDLYFAPEERGSHLLDTGQEEVDVYRMRRKDGSEIWVEDHGYYVHDEQGEILYHEGMLRDITTRKKAEEALRESEQNYRTLANSGQALIWTSGIDALRNYFNDIWLEFTGRTIDQELGGGWSEGVHPDDLQHCIKTYMGAFERRGSFSMEYRLRRHDGEYRWIQDDGSPQYNTMGEFIGYIGYCLDIAERKLEHEIIRESEERLAAVMEGSQLGYSDWNIQTGEIRRNERWANMLGYTLKEIESTYRQWDDLLHPEDRASALQSIQNHFDGKTPIHRAEYRLRAKDGTYRWVLDQGKILEYDLQGLPQRMTATQTDITERKQAESELRQAKEALEITHKELEQAFAREQELARIDVLTGIKNRRYLFELAEREFNIAIRYLQPLSVLMFDVDDFKLINDGFGHAIGDQVLRHLAQVVCARLRSADVIGRYGGDEFIILLPQTNVQEAQSLAERIHASIASIRMETDKGMITLSISLGIAQTIHHAVEPDTVENLLLRADQALYAAKQAGRNRTVIFDEE